MNNLLTENRQRLWSSIVIDQFIKSNVDQFYVSPGMRNAPLIAAIKNNKMANLITGIDERAHAFRALGYAKASGKAAVLICTSGTAYLNYAPAIAEAFKSRTPLIVLTADRPKELVWGNANQTLAQTGNLNSFFKQEFELPAPNENFDISNMARLVCHLSAVVLDHRIGPVHLNMPFKEPLDQQTEELSIKEIKSAQHLIEQNVPFTKFESGIKVFPSSLPESLLTLLKNSQNPLLVVGELSPYENKEKIKALLNVLDIPFYLDISSSLKSYFHFEDGAIPTFDHPEVVSKISKDTPDLIIHLGGRLISKWYYKYLSKYRDIPLVHIDQSSLLDDPSMRVNIKINGEIQAVAASLIEQVHLLENNTPINHWPWAKFIDEKANVIESSSELSYPLVSKYIMENTLSDCLYIGNSTVVRSFDNYASESKVQINKAPKKVILHRGASGIEGFVSASLGALDAGEKQVTLLLGDISLLHDLNSLLTIKKENNLKIIILNNKGGGIFNLLPAGKDHLLKEAITTPHSFEFENLCQSLDLNYYRSTTIKDFKEFYNKLYQTQNAAILEVLIDDEYNQQIYEQLKTVKL